MMRSASSTEMLPLSMSSSASESTAPRARNVSKRPPLADLSSTMVGATLSVAPTVMEYVLGFPYLDPAWYTEPRFSRGWLFALLAFLGFANALVPWTVRNYQLTGAIVPVVDSAWWHLWIGNSPDATGGPQDTSPDHRGRLVGRVLF